MKIKKRLAELMTIKQKTDIVTKRHKLVAPVDGVVHELIVKGNGETVEGGDTLLTIVPDGSNVIAEIQVTNRELSYLYEGQKTLLRLDAMPYQKFGKLNGVIMSISPSTVKNQDEIPVYIVRVKPEKQFLYSNKGEKHYLQSGMTVAADFITRNKSIIDFIIEPLNFQFDRAFRDPSTRN